jgi:membrane protein
MPDTMPRHQESGPPIWALALVAVASAALVLGWSDSNRTALGKRRSADEPAALQYIRAREPERGRDAASPWHIPWRGWKDIFWRTYEKISRDRLLAIAAGTVFYGLLALVPAITAFVSFYGLFATTSTINQHIELLSGVLPGGGLDIVQEQVARIVSKSDGRLSFGFIFGLSLALWSANAGMKAIIDALNIVYEEDEKRGIIKLNLVSFAFTLGAIVALLLAVAAVVVFPLLLAAFGLESMTANLISILRWPLLLLMVMSGLALIYRYGPSRCEPKWQWVSVGSVSATIAWLAGSALLSWYLSSIANYNATYGSLGAAIGLMTWMWMSSIVVLLGAELNSEIEHQTARDTTVGPEKPLGARRATMADTVGAAKT